MVIEFATILSWMLSYYRDQFDLESSFVALIVFSLTAPRMLVGLRLKVVGEPSHPLLVATTPPIYKIISKVVYVLLSSF